MSTHLIKNPTWPTGPDICDYEMLPAFPTQSDAMAYHSKLGENPAVIKIMWQCKVCGQWHYAVDVVDWVPRYVKDQRVKPQAPAS